MASHGGFQIIEMGPDVNWKVKNMLLPAEYLKSLEDHVLLGFSGISRMSEQHAKNKVDNIKRGKTNKELQTIHALAQESLQAFQDQAGFDENGAARWQVRVWWKPFVTFIWYGGLLVSLGGVMAIIGRLLADLRRRRAKTKGDERREDVAALSDEAMPEPAE